MFQKQKTRYDKHRLKLDFETFEPRLLMAVDTPFDGAPPFSINPGETQFLFAEPLKSSAGASNSSQSFSKILVKENGRTLSRRGILTTNATIQVTATATNRGRAISNQPAFAWQTTSQPAANAATLTTSGSGLTIRFSRAGSFQFRVSSGSVSTVFSVQVNSAVAGFSVSPHGVSLAPGAAQRYFAQPVDQFGNHVALSRFAVRWSATGGTIDANGNYLAGSQQGTYAVTATAMSGLSGSRSVQVSVQPRQLADGTLKQLVDSSYTDQLLNRNEVMQILRSVGGDNVVTASELSELRYLVSQDSGYRMYDHVRSLATDVLNSNPANQRYQGAALGNLQAGSSAGHLNKLVDKWFLGTDLPTVTAGSGLTYQWAAGSLFNQTPSLLDTKQGQVGNCYFLASLSSIAHRNPAAISNMFINNGDNTFTVRFFTGEYGYMFTSSGAASYGFANGIGTPTYITVNRMLPATSSGRFGYSNMGLSLSSTTVPLWLALAEKAYAQWNETGRADRNGSNTYAGIVAGWMTDVNAQVIGTNSSTDWLNSSSKTKLLQALQAGEAVTIGTTASANQAANWVPNHAYVISRYNAATDTFDLHNPWGTRHMANMSWQQLLNNCDAIVVTSQVGSQVQTAPRVRGEVSPEALRFVWNVSTSKSAKPVFVETKVCPTVNTSEFLTTLSVAQVSSQQISDATCELGLVIRAESKPDSMDSSWESLDRAFAELEA
jgi:hypothetical protein